jgi:hypothetical protein
MDKYVLLFSAFYFLNFFFATLFNRVVALLLLLAQVDHCNEGLTFCIIFSNYAIIFNIKFVKCFLILGQ